MRGIRAKHEGCGMKWIDLDEIEIPSVAVIDCFGATSLSEVLELLARIGLGEAWTYLRTPSQLSEGQRWRLKLALALHRARQIDGPAILACDEFAAVLDRVTAIIIAHRLRRAIDANPHLAAIVATSHDDLEAPLSPEMIVRCDFGKYELSHR
jgi:ABC-type ATPase with predicted acetyltransferase domain